MKRICAVALLAGLLCTLTGTEAVGRPDKPADMIHAYRVWKLTEILNLTDEQMPVFFARLKELDEKELDLVKQEQEGVREIGELLDKNDVSEADLRAALDRYQDTRANLMQEIRNLREQTLSVLDTRQKCQYVVFEQRFRGELRDMIDRARGFGRSRVDRPGPGGGLGGADPGGDPEERGLPGGSGWGRH